MEKLGKLINELGANGVVRIDEGNGSAGPTWCDWGDDMQKKYGSVVMMPVTDDTHDGYVYRQIIPDGTVSHGSDWIEDGQGVNPYKYRFIL
jgi:hypothetical protein